MGRRWPWIDPSSFSSETHRKVTNVRREKASQFTTLCSFTLNSLVFYGPTDWEHLKTVYLLLPAAGGQVGFPGALQNEGSSPPVVAASLQSKNWLQQPRSCCHSPPQRQATHLACAQLLSSRKSLSHFLARAFSATSIPRTLPTQEWPGRASPSREGAESPSVAAGRTAYSTALPPSYVPRQGELFLWPRAYACAHASPSKDRYFNISGWLSKSATLNFKLTNHVQQNCLVCRMRLVNLHFSIAFLWTTNLKFTVWSLLINYTNSN